MTKKNNLEETFNTLNDFLLQQWKQGLLLRLEGVAYTTEQDCLLTFGLKEDAAMAESFMIQVGAVLAPELKGKNLKCTLANDDKKPGAYFQIYSDLLTGEELLRDRRNLGRRPFFENPYEFWLVWLRNPDEDIYNPHRLVPVVIPPLVLD